MTHAAERTPASPIACATGKIEFESWEAAADHLRELRELRLNQGVKGSKNAVEQRVYYCMLCGSHHLTAKTNTKGKLRGSRGRPQPGRRSR